jgi:NAD(P)-dependent dehydrogenase (short-subunit alcohol dehydrogenase family)
MGLLEGKVAVVTGAARGIGRGHALELAAQGASVVVNDLGCSTRGDGGSELDASKTVDIIEARGGRAVADGSDIADFDGASALIDKAVEVFGRLDIVVNNAGIVRDAMVFNMAEADWDAVIRVHLKGTFATTHHASRYWRNESKAGRPVAGRIINTASGAAIRGNPGQAAYTAAKAGIMAMTQTTAIELSRIGVTVNCIAPAGSTRIASTIPGAGIETREADEYEEWGPMDPSLGSPLVAWLASDEAAHVSGQVFRAYGESIVWLRPWSFGPSISRPGGPRWKPEELGHLLAGDVFGTRELGMRY